MAEREVITPPEQLTSSLPAELREEKLRYALYCIAMISSSREAMKAHARRTLEDVYDKPFTKAGKADG